MGENEYKTIRVYRDGAVCTVTLARPEVHNAFNAEMIAELRLAFEVIASEAEADRLALRVVVLEGEGKSFCAGADVNWMQASLRYTLDENREDAARMSAMFRTINECTVPVIAKVHGAALGGGAGLIAVSDIVLAAEDTKFAFSEVKLGIAPAVISPFVLAKIGRSHARALFVTGERFDTERAVRIGLAHVSVGREELDAEVRTAVEHVLSSTPTGIAHAKELIAKVPDLTTEDATQLTVNTIAELRVGAEGQEGLGAFLERRKPEWAL